jgi:hypothetical protein
VVVLWIGLQLIAVGLSEAAGRFVFWWLEPHRRVKLLHPSRYQPSARPATRPAPARPPARQTSPGT